MAINKSTLTVSTKSLLFPFILAFLITFSTAARILDEATTAPGGGAPGATSSGGATAGATTTSAGGATGVATGPDDEETGSATVPGSGASGAATAPGGGATGTATTPGGGAASTATAPEEGAAAATAPDDGATGAATVSDDGTAGVATTPGSGAAGAGTASGSGGATSAGLDGLHPDLTFFMHDILGGSNPTAKAITGIVTNPAVSGQVPFAKPNGAILPTSNGVPQNNANSGLINNNNLPFLTGLGGINPNVLQNNGNNNFFGGNGFPVVNGAQLSAGTTLEKLMFGTMMAIDDQITEGHELGSGLVGKAQGFYIYSSVDGKTQTMIFTVMFQEGGYVDSLNLFGVHQTVVTESQFSIMGGTGKYVNAKGCALVKTLPPLNQHQTDGLETVLEFHVFLTE